MRPRPAILFHKNIGIYRFFRSSSEVTGHDSTQTPTSVFPHIIIGESHTDRIQHDTLTRLAPSLKTMGYKHVLLELNNHPGWGPVEHQIKTENRYYKFLKKEFNRLDLNITNPAQVDYYFRQFLETHLHAIENEYENGRLDGLQLIHMTQKIMRQKRTLECIIQFRNNTEALGVFVSAFKKLGFTCRGIDVATGISTASSAEEITRTLDARSDAMAEEIKKTSIEAHASITIVGLAHLPRIQEQLIKSFGTENAATKFRYFNFTAPDRKKSAHEERILNGAIHFPAGLERIDHQQADNFMQILNTASHQASRKLN